MGNAVNTPSTRLYAESKYFGDSMPLPPSPLVRITPFVDVKNCMPSDIASGTFMNTSTSVEALAPLITFSSAVHAIQQTINSMHITSRKLF